MTTNTGFEQPRIPAGSSPRERRAQAQMAGGHSVLKELGLGTNDPERALHMVKETAGAAVLLERIQASVNSGALQSRKSRGTLDARAAVVDDDDLLTVSGFAYVGDNNEYQESCRIEYEVDGSVSDASKGAPGRIVFRTSSGSALTKRMRITKDGKVGIGLDDPSTRLTVEGAVTLKEQASADADVASYGQLWVKTATPNELYFTTDAGNDIQLTSGTAMAGGDITSVVAGAGMTGGATSGAATLNVIGGDGITANADEIEATVDGSTIELSASDGSGTIRIKDNGVTLAKMAGIARGKIIYGDASGDPAVLAVGDADQVLTTDGTDISWEDAGGGSGDITAVTIETDSGSGSKASDTGGSADFTLLGGSGVDVTNSSATITVAGEDATTSNKGVASFHSDNFSVSSGAVTIKDQGVLYAEIQNVSATDRILGRDSSGAGSIEEITPANLRTMINVADGAEVNESAFKTISVSGQDNVVADADADTLTLAAGTNVTITTTAASDTVTITSADTNTTYSAGTLLDLATTTFNVDLTEASEQAIANGDYILFLDGGATGSHAKENIADVATLFAGDGLTASSAVMAVNVDDSTIETNSDAIRIKDNGVTLAKMAGLARGKIIYGDASGDPAALAVGSANTVLQTDGTDASWGTVATAMIADNAVTLAKMAGLARGKIIHGDASGDPAALAVGGAKTVLQSDGTDSSWGTVATAMIADNAVSLAKMAGLTRGSIIYGDASGDPAALGVGSNTYVLTSDGTDVAWAAASGGGSGDVEAGSTFTTAGVIMACDGDDKTIDEPNALLTTNGQGMTVSAALATPFQVDSSTRDGNSTFKFTTGSGSGTNNQASMQIIAQTAANANLYLGDTDSATRGGLTYKNNGDSMQLKAAGAAVLELDSAKVVEFKIAEVADSGSDYQYDSKVLTIKVNGTEYFLPLYAEAGGGGGMP